VLHDGRKVAVKIQKPYIEDQLPYDLFVYKSIVQLFEWWFEIPMYWTVPPVVASLNDESNFLIEAENTKKASRLLEHQMGDRGPSYVPQVYDDYTTEKVLTMEWIDGVKITSTEDLQRWGFGKKQFQSMIIREFAYQVCV
jgi:predicted unusual protein kinase regulating ubiquinone biosynthesis (AarF/ABC1/UbiB family)